MEFLVAHWHRLLVVAGRGEGGAVSLRAGATNLGPLGISAQLGEASSKRGSRACAHVVRVRKRTARMLVADAHAARGVHMGRERSTTVEQARLIIAGSQVAHVVGHVADALLSGRTRFIFVKREPGDMMFGCVAQPTFGREHPQVGAD